MMLHLARAAAATACLASFAGCGPGALLSCRLRAAEALPADVSLINARDAALLVSRLNACAAEAALSSPLPAEPATSSPAATPDAGP